MLTDYEIKFLRECSETELMESIIEKCTRVPTLLITIDDGRFQYASSNMVIDLIIEDKDAIASGDGLHYPCTIENNPQDFEIAYQEAKLSIARHHAYLNNNKEIQEIRIFIHDPEDDYPVNLMVDDEIIATFKDYTDAIIFLREYKLERDKK